MRPGIAVVLKTETQSHHELVNLTDRGSHEFYHDTDKKLYIV